MDTESLIEALSGGSTFREKSGLPEAEDIAAVLVRERVKENLLKKAADKLLAGSLLTK